MTGTPYAFFRGQVVPLDEAKVSIMTHALHYGTAVFEGVRGNWNEEKKAIYIFRLREHYERMLRGCRLMMLDIPYSCEELCNITVDLVERCGYTEDIYIRPLAYKRGSSKVANLRTESDCDVRHRLALRPECGGDPTFNPERRQSPASNVVGFDCGSGRKRWESGHFHSRHQFMKP